MGQVNEEDHPHGLGYMENFNGDTYKGEWSCGIKDGTGEKTYLKEEKKDE
jgi:hypothetical protein